MRILKKPDFEGFDENVAKSHYLFSSQMKKNTKMLATFAKMSIFAPDEIREKRVRFSQESIRWELLQMSCEIFKTCILLIIS